MVFDSRLGSLHRRLQERVRVAREFQHYTNLPVRPPIGGIEGGYCWLVSHHAALYHVLLRAGIRHRCQRVHNQFRI